MPIYQGYPICIAGQRRKICGLLHLYACYAIVTSYGMKDDPKIEGTQKRRKGEQSSVGDRLSEPRTHSIKFHQDIPYGYLVIARIS